MCVYMVMHMPLRNTLLLWEVRIEPHIRLYLPLRSVPQNNESAYFS